MTTGIKLRLGAMMFLEFFIWGGWFVTMGSYLAANLGASGAQSALAYSTQSWGAIIAPFVVGLIADKFFNAERLLGIMHLIGAVLLYSLANATVFEGFYPYLLSYMIIFMPTLALVNSVSFRLTDDPSQQFSKIRVWGTVGWIVAGLVISYAFSWDSHAAIAAGMLKHTFTMSAIASALLGIFSFTLPATPPQVKAGQWPSVREMLGLDALSLLRDQKFPGVLSLLDPDLHSPRVLLSACQSISHRDPGDQCHRQADAGADVGSLLHAADSIFPGAARNEGDFAGRYARLGGALCHVRLRQRR